MNINENQLVYSTVHTIFGMKFLLFRIDYVFLAFCLFFVIALVYLFVQNRRSHKKLDQMTKLTSEINHVCIEKLEYFHKLFEGHFKVTDQTIVDLRKQRDALQKEVKRLKKKLGDK